MYRFIIYLDSVSAPKIMTNQIDNGKKSRDALSIMILDKVVEVRDITSDKYGRYYANIFLGDIHINEWLCTNNYAIKSKNGRSRRMSESDSYSHDKRTIPKNILPILFPNIDSILDNSISGDWSSYSHSYKKRENTFLPNIDFSNGHKKQEINRTCSSISVLSTIQTDCFLSHNWGENKKNHEGVKLVNDALKRRGWKTWFDENKIDGNIRYKMAEGIDNTKCVIVFITKEYREKVNGLDMTDNCKYEFTYAMNQLGSQNMIPVIMESEMKDTKKWKGELGAALGSMLYIDFSSEHLSNITGKKYDELSKRIQTILHRDSNK
jgi:hypothetical protein